MSLSPSLKLQKYLVARSHSNFLITLSSDSIFPNQHHFARTDYHQPARMRRRKVWQWGGSSSSEKSAWCDVKNYEIGKRSESSSNVKVFLFFSFSCSTSTAFITDSNDDDDCVCQNRNEEEKHTRKISSFSNSSRFDFFFFISFSLSLPSIRSLIPTFRRLAWLCFFFFPDHPQSLSSSNLNCLLFSSAALAPSRAHTPSSFLASFTLARSSRLFSLCFFFASLFLFWCKLVSDGEAAATKVLRTDSLTTLCYRVDFNFNFPTLTANSPKCLNSSHRALCWCLWVKSAAKIVYIFCRNYLSTCA